MIKGQKTKNDFEISPEDILKKIEPNSQTNDRLQIWDSNSCLLAFAYGDSKDTVYIHSNKQTSFANKTLKSKLDQDTANYLLQDTDKVSNDYILSKIETILKDYIYFEDSRLYTLISIWIIGTYLYTMFGHYGYLFFYSKLMRSGKTRVQEVISHLGFEASDPQNAPTPPVIRELAAEGGTVQLDTLERWQEKNKESFSAAMEMLDAGFRNGGQVSKMVQDVNGKWVKEKYHVYAPYILSGIYKESLSDTAQDRAFNIEMKRKQIGLKKKRYNYFNCEKECSTVRSHLYIWAFQNAQEVCHIYQSKELQIELDQLHLNDRAGDIWLPILTIAKAIGFGKDSKEWQNLILIAQEMGGDIEYAEDAQLLTIIQALRGQVDENGKVIGITSILVKILKEKEVNITKHELTHLLKHCGFEQQSIRFPEGPRRGWKLEDEKLAEIEEQLKIAVAPQE